MHTTFMFILNLAVDLSPSLPATLTTSVVSRCTHLFSSSQVATIKIAEVFSKHSKYNAIRCQFIFFFSCRFLSVSRRCLTLTFTSLLFCI